MKNSSHIWNQHPQIVQMQKIVEKEILNLGPAMPYLGIFGCRIENIIPLLKSVPSSIVKYQDLRKTKKNSNLGQKILYLDIFRSKFEKLLSYPKSATSS